MNINQLIEIVEKKILSQDCISKVYIEDKSFLHKNHKSNESGKFHILLSIESPELKKKNKLYSTRFIYNILEDELKKYIHSLQIKLI
jgi:BolA protein